MTENNNKFAQLFKNGDGFYNLTPFSDAYGFSIKRKLKGGENDHVSLLTFHIPDSELNSKKNKKIIKIRATYGKESENGVSIRDVEKSRISDPADLEKKDIFFFDNDKEVLFRKNKEIKPSQLLDNIYNSHIKPTKSIAGIWVKSKMFFWRIVMTKIFDVLSKCCYYFLLLLSGDRYEYKPILGEEVLNNKIISSKFESRLKLETPKLEEDIKESKKIELLGYKASHWPIIFYSVFHISLYVIFKLNNYYPDIVVTMLKNNFITVIYVITSLWILEIVIPKILKLHIKIFSKASVNSMYRNISI